MSVYRIASMPPRVVYVRSPRKFSISMYPLIIATILLLFPVIIATLLIRNRSNSSPPATLILTVSPANHSPRAHAHATACLHAAQTAQIILIAEPPAPTPHPSIRFIPLPTVASVRTRSPRSLLTKLFVNAKSLFRALHLASALPFRITHVILNSPPALPVLPVLLVASRTILPRPQLILDWHNLAHTIMRTTNSPPRLVRLAARLESLVAVAMDRHWAVSRHLADHLHETCSIRPAVVYDRPRSQFTTVASQSQRDIALRVAKHSAVRVGRDVDHDVDVVVTSTSWTPDEDFAILFHALCALDADSRSLLTIVTGKGPLRDPFIQRLRAANLQHVAVWFVWMPEHLYPHLLQTARLGISLHASSSGLDLPMKAVDMLGAGLPVLALRYKCIHELVVEGKTGMLFDDAQGLASALTSLLFVESGRKKRTDMALHIREIYAQRTMQWQFCWERDALPSMKPQMTPEHVS